MISIIEWYFYKKSIKDNKYEFLRINFLAVLFSLWRPAKWDDSEI